MTASRWQALIPQDEARRSAGFLAAVVLDLVALALLGWLVVVGTPAIAIGVRHGPDDRWRVSSVAPGGDAWNDGIRPGMEIIGISPSDALPSGDWQSLLVTDGALQITIQRHDLPPTPDPLIASAAALVAAILAFRYVPTVAWLLTLAPPAIASLNGAMLVDPPINLTFEAIGPLVAALFVTSAASRPRGRWSALGPVVVIVYLVAWLVACAASWGNWTVIRDAGLLASLALGALGAATSLSRAIERARSRSAQRLAGLPLPVAVGAIIDELVPGRTRTRLSAIERERARLATELHADVLPDLSDVIRSIEEGDSPRAAADRLRAISAELRELMAERRLSILEDQGLVPALEWLVEHVEARTGVRVELDVESARLGAEDRPPREVEMASYRVCQAALDNALIHARPTAIRGGHLGLVDMRTRAATIGGTLQVGRRPDGGTLVLLRWPA
jgi:signal transduction histidine kinase